jgi:hypothetical protein
LREDFAQGIAGGCQVCQPHLGILARQDDTICLCAKNGANEFANIVVCCALFRDLGICQSWNVNIASG